MMWFVPSLQDMRCFLVFVILTAVSFLGSYFFIMERAPDSKMERMQTSILVYGSMQSFIGLLGGFYVSKLLYFSYPPPHASSFYVREGGYGFVKSDDEIMAEV